MILNTVKTNTIFRVNVENLSQTRMTTGIGFLKYENSYSIFINKKVYKIKIVDENELDQIEYFLRIRNNVAMTNIIEAIRDKYFTMEIIFLNDPIKNIFEPFYVSLDEEILKTAKRRNLIKKKDDINELTKVLKEKITFMINNESYFLISTANSSVNEVFDFSNEIASEKEKLEKEKRKLKKNEKIIDEEKQKKISEIDKKIKKLYSDEEINKFKKLTKDLAFTIHGENFHLPIKKNIFESGDYKFTATRLVSFKNRIQKDSLRIIKGELEFKNGLMSARVTKELSDVIECDDSYLKIWDKYLEEEGNILLKKARRIGELKLSNIKLTGDEYELKFEKIPDELKENDFICFVDNVSSYLEKDDQTFKEYLFQKEEKKDILKDTESKPNSFKIEKKSGSFITIKTEKNLNDYQNKKVVLSIYGDEIHLSRKYQARKRLLDGESAYPHLGLIIDGKDKNGKDRAKDFLTPSSKRIEPLTLNVEKKIFDKNPPTQNQIDAIDIALNTPDIAIIQGPPGTGKTTVLTAIMEMLNAEADKTKNIRGEILVAGFQHDAVENIISRLEINGIPTPKFGKPSTTIVDMNSYDRVISWSKDIAKTVKNNLPELSNQIKIDKLNKYVEIYLKSPSNSFTLNLLNYISDELFSKLDEKLIEKCQNLIEKFKENKIKDINELKNIYSLRTSTISFLDDGINRNQDLLVSSLGEILSDNEKSILRYSGDNNLEEYLRRLSKLKYSLIDRLSPKPIFRSEKANEEILQFIGEVEENLKMGGSIKDIQATILSNYVNELENNPFALKSIIQEYSYVFSSTTGQSSKASKEKKNNSKGYTSFDTLIIDEAARVTPMDLLIVMVLAKRRIILVGDHRQLPHMIDDDVVMNADLSEERYIKDSMFGYLKERADELERIDGIKRAITLENQYRTHPLLGDFVSNNFYKPYKEEFNSPLGTTIGEIEDFFYQNLEGIENTPNVWIDVKYDSSNKQPRSRESEAKKIIEKLRIWIDSEDGKDLDYGIISFYRDQVNIIKKELQNEFSKEEREKFKHRLKIGTVDSFQGMEFDIVLLSVVRSKNIKYINDKIENYKLFGFLTSKNRLCVSMSRQKKSLIVVGDKDFFEHKRAKQDIPELYSFLQLCKEKGKIL